MTDATEVEAQVEGDAVAGSDPGTAEERAGSPEREEPGQEQDEVFALRGQVASLTNDLQRLQAEYANYRKRVDRDRQLIADSASYKALTPVIEVLDTIDRAKEHGELDGGLKAVADQLERVVAAAGLVRFGDAGRGVRPDAPRGAEPPRHRRGGRGDDDQARRQERLHDGRPRRARRPGARGRPRRALTPTAHADHADERRGFTHG